MLSLGSRFAHYGLTGGFLLLANFLLFFLVSSESLQSEAAKVGTTIDNLLSLFPKSLENGAGAVFAVIFILLCFFVGLVLEMLGSFSAIREAGILSRNLERYKIWLAPVLSEISSSANKDLEEILTTFSKPYMIEMKEGLLHLVFFWRKGGLKAIYDDHTRSVKKWRIFSSCSRIESLLISYSLASDKAAIADLLRDKMHVCVISRAISIALGILYIEMLWFIYLIASGSLKLAFSAVTILLALQTISILLAAFIPIRAYSRFCDSLFSIVLIQSLEVARRSNSK